MEGRSESDRGGDEVHLTTFGDEENTELKDVVDRAKLYCLLSTLHQEASLFSTLQRLFIDPKDLKSVPSSWIPADGVEKDPDTGNFMPDANGHVPGSNY